MLNVLNCRSHIQPTFLGCLSASLIWTSSHGSVQIFCMSTRDSKTHQNRLCKTAGWKLGKPRFQVQVSYPRFDLGSCLINNAKPRNRFFLLHKWFIPKTPYNILRISLWIRILRTAWALERKPRFSHLFKTSWMCICYLSNLISCAGTTSSSGCFHPGGTYQSSVWNAKCGHVDTLCIFVFEKFDSLIHKTIYKPISTTPIYKPFGSQIPWSLTSRSVDGGTFNSCAAFGKNGISWIHKVHQIHLWKGQSYYDDGFMFNAYIFCIRLHTLQCLSAGAIHQTKSKLPDST